MGGFFKTGVVQSVTFYESGSNFVGLLEEDDTYLIEENNTIIIDESSTDDMATDSADIIALSGQAMSVTDSYILAGEFIEY